jgi:Flp pilus assembly CpaE family ATPase
VGKTTTTTYVSAGLQRFNIPVGIVELDEDKPGIASIFLGNEKTRRDVGLDKIDLKTYRSETLLEKELKNVRLSLSKGIMLYPNSGNGDGMPFEETDDVYRLFEVVQRQHPMVMVDLPVRLRDLVVLSTLRRANRVFFICEQYQPTIDACARHLEDAVKLGINPDKYVLVISKYTEDSRIKVARIETALGMKAKALIPLDAERYRVAADNHKITIHDDDPWVSLAAMVAGVDAPVVTQKVKRKTKGIHGSIMNLFGLAKFLKRKSEASA